MIDKCCTTFYAGIVLLLLTAGAYGQSFFPTSLTCEHLTDPIGIDAEKPRLAWKIATDDAQFQQGAYEIIVSDDVSLLQKGVGNAWHSGKVSGARTLVAYNGKKLKPRTRYYWMVSTWDENGTKSAARTFAYFETGKLDEPWRAQWITDVRDTAIQPAAYFRKVVSLGKKVVSARAYIAAAGLFELSVNGRKIGDGLLNPMFTRFDKRNLYLTLDVTGVIQKGENAIGMILGNGWYNHQSWSEWDFHKAVWRDRPAFCMEIHVDYADGSSEKIYSDATWKTALGPIIFNSIYTGEHYDARKEQRGWNLSSFDDAGWHPAIGREAPSPRIIAQALEPIRIVDKFGQLEITKISDSAYLYKLPENIAGITKLSVQGERGTTFRIKHGETIDHHNHVDQSTIDIYSDQKNGLDPFQTDIFILKGEGLEEFMPRFNYKGFQYVEVTADRPVDLRANNLTAYRINSDVRPVGKIESSNELVNKIWAATNRSYLSNLHGYPTDCPQREKNGWTGDAHIAIEAALFNYDAITVYEKWLADHRDAQLENGVLPAIIPTSTWGYDWGNGVDWTSSTVIIPWTLYRYYGDARALLQNYSSMKRFVDYVTSIAPEGLTDWGLGDWVPYKTIADKQLLISLYYYQDALILSKTAGLLGHRQDSVAYGQVAHKIKQAINDKFLDKEKAIYATGSQAELSGPLYWGVVPEAYRQQVADNLAKRVVADDKHLDVGLLGSKTLLGALSDNGYADLAFEVATQQTYPSWGWWIRNGATTLYETWKIETETLSRNHVMFGEISAWFYKALGGINADEQNPGFRTFVVRPHFVKGMDSFRAIYDSPGGEIVSSWNRINDRVAFDLTIPPNTQATVRLEDVVSAIDSNTGMPIGIDSRTGNGDFHLGSGSYRFLVADRIH
ncbi:alpha-rhamnosidase [Parapedobacter defluvii]|uniref:alpha-L-rhamnosidase n=1 Tax=Parapedobacter defluvii TaxID=2045106 RepID=A0ABQ1LZ86_9SPHI|nr:alpha-L-rhamnosidase [Parapedobacter defluvii]GGC30153.1 alpha-rhamnosidase [Parapedobacter defluvii]